MAFFTDPLNLVLLLIAAVAGFKLWQVLGMRMGAEPTMLGLNIKSQPMPPESEMKDITPPKPVWYGVAEEGSALAQSLQIIADKMSSFSGAEFLKTATLVHERIMDAFAAGDSATLKLLLNEPTYNIFKGEIERRAAAGEQVVFKFIGPESAKLLAARVNGNLASLEMALTSQVISAIKDKSGVLLSGDEKQIVSLREVWTFERILGSSDPNWLLADTRENA